MHQQKQNLNPKPNLLRELDLASTVTRVTPAPTVADRIRSRIRDEMDTLSITQRELTDVLSRQTREVWTQSRVGKILTGRVELCVADVAAMANALGITLVEAVRDRGLEFFAEMRPSEVRIIERLRRRPDLHDAILTILDVSHAPRPKGGKKVGRPLNSDLARRIAHPPQK